MRPLIAAPLLGLLFMAGCAQPQYLVSERVDSSPTASIAGPVSLRIGAGFTADQQASIMAAVQDWNQAHSGGDIAVAPGIHGAAQPGTWTVIKPNPAELAKTDEWQVRPAAITQRFPAGGGSIVVDINRLGARDLREVVVRQIDVAMNADTAGTTAR